VELNALTQDSARAPRPTVPPTAPPASAARWRGETWGHRFCPSRPPKLRGGCLTGPPQSLRSGKTNPKPAVQRRTRSSPRDRPTARVPEPRGGAPDRPARRHAEAPICTGGAGRRADVRGSAIRTPRTALISSPDWGVFDAADEGVGLRAGRVLSSGAHEDVPIVVAVAAGDVDPDRGRARLSYRRAQELFKTASRDRTLHKLRHSRLTHLAEASVNVARQASNGKPVLAASFPPLLVMNATVSRPSGARRVNTTAGRSAGTPGRRLDPRRCSRPSQSVPISEGRACCLGLRSCQPSRAARS
jgi:hypothetical protein